MSFAKLYQNILLIDFDTIFDNVLRSEIVANTIRGMNYEQIFIDGIDGNGQRINPKDKSYQIYSEKYERLKTSWNLYQGYVDLSVNGKFLKSLNVEYENNQLFIFFPNIPVGRWNLSEILRTRYGADIEGLTTNNFNKLCKNIILPLLQIDCLNALKTALQP